MPWAIFCAFLSVFIFMGNTKGPIKVTSQVSELYTESNFSIGAFEDDQGLKSLPMNAQQPDSKAKKIVLDMAPNAFDDQYKDCDYAMENRIIADGLLKKELSRNSVLRQQWDRATQEWLEKKKSGSLPPLPKGFKDAYGVALMTYTGAGIYKEFNDAVQKGGQSLKYYMNNFHFKSLHFYLTRAFQLLREDCKTDPKDVYRGVGVWYEPLKGYENTMRFGQFTSTSLDKKEAETYGTTSFFTIRTCFGIRIRDFSYLPIEAEVLIPANEVFTVTKYRDTEQGHRFVLTSTQGTCNKYNCAYLSGTKSKSSGPYFIYNSAPGGDNKFLLLVLFSGFLMIRAGVLMIFSLY